MATGSFTKRGAVVTAAVALALGAGMAPAAAAPDNTQLGRKLAREVALNGVNRHLIALQRIAEQNGGTRASGTPGFAASRTYVENTARAAGLRVSTQEFQFPYFEELAPAELDRVSPDPKVFAPGTEVVTYSLSGAGEVTARVQAVDLQLPPAPTPSSTSGCEAADFAGFTPGSIALIQRGSCFFEDKVNNAEAAGAVAVIFMNEGQPGRTDPFAGDLTSVHDIPVVGISFAEGARFAQLIAAGPVTARVQTSVRSELRPTWNVIAETRGGRADNVVVAGAHLDSVLEGPGINDNGTGTAALLELGKQLAGEKVKNKVRLIWWGAEESGLLGSEDYVSRLTFEQQLDIALYLNFDMIGSPNWAEFVYDGDDSDGAGAGAGPYGSAQIESLLQSYLGERSVPTVGTDFDGRSDYGAFIAVGIPSGGTFTGAEGIKTPEQAAVYGGVAGQPYDRCYHQACDNLGNVNRTALDLNADAVAFAVGRYALDTSDVNGSASTAAKRAGTRVATKVAPAPVAGQA